MAVEFDEIILKNPNITFEELKKYPEFASLALKLQKGGAFPSDDSAYRQILNYFRLLPKKDYHCHISMGLNVRQIAKLIANLDDADYQKVMKNLRKAKGWRWFVVRYLSRGKRKNAHELKKIIRFSGLLKTWDGSDFYVVSLAALGQMVKQTAKNYLRDRVESFSVRFNPFKPEMYPRNTDIFEVFIKTMDVVIRSLDEAAKAYRCEPRKLNVIISINRLRQERLFGYCREVFSRWNEIPENVRRRITGFDLAGPEGSLNSKVKPEDWLALLGGIPQKLEFTPHLADIRNMKKGSRLHRYTQNFMLAEQKKDLLSLVEHEYDFMEEYLRLMPENSSMAHGIALAERIVLLKPQRGSKSRVYVFDLREKLNNSALDARRLKLQERLAVMKGIVRAKNISFYFCPTATAKSAYVADFAELPIFEWVTLDGFRVKIGVDGVFRGGMNEDGEARTLSEEMTKLFLTKPVYGKSLSLKQIISLAD